MINSLRKNVVPDIDIVIPLHNEEKMLPLLVEKLEEIFSSENLGRNKIGSLRYVFIDDGSTDASLDFLKNKLKIANKAKIISLSRNFGHQAAVSAGLSVADSQVVAVIDADLQDPPDNIIDMLKLWRDGYDVIYGLRKRRKEGILKNICYKFFYRIYKFLSPVAVPVDSGDFCIMDKKVVDVLKGFPEKLRFHRGLRAWVGFNQIGFEYERPKRAAGESKYTFKDLYNLATEGITSMSITPLKVSQFFALAFFLFSLIIFLLVRIRFFENTGIDLVFALTLLYAVGNSIILLCLYILGAYVGRSYLEIKNRPTYIISEVLDI